MKRSDRFATGFTYASEKTKQLITLSTGVIAVTISFSKDIFGGVVAEWTLVPLFVAWVLFLLSVVSGVKLLGNMAARLLAGPLDSSALDGADISTLARNQRSCFYLGLVLTIIFGICSTYISIHEKQAFVKKSGFDSHKSACQ